MMWRKKKDALLGNHVEFSGLTYNHNPIMIWNEYQKIIKSIEDKIQESGDDVFKFRISYQTVSKLLEDDTKTNIDLPCGALEMFIPYKVQRPSGNYMRSISWAFMNASGWYDKIDFKELFKKMKKTFDLIIKKEAIIKERDYFFPKGEP